MAETITKEQYKAKVAELQKKRKQLESLGYESDKRGYVFNGKVLSKSDIDAQIAETKTTEQNLLIQLKKGLKESDTARQKSLGLGNEYQKLVDTADSIKVTNYESSIEKLKAWKNVQNFVESNKDILIPSTQLKARGGFPLGGGGGTYVPGENKPIDIKKVTQQFESAKRDATKYSEKDTTKSTDVQVIKAGKTLIRPKVEVTDEPTLSARQIEIDSITAGQEPPVEVATSARKGAAPVSSIALTKPAVTTTTTSKIGKAVTTKETITPKYGSKSQFEAANPYVPFPGGTSGTGTGTGLKKGEVLFDGKKVTVGGSKWQQIIQDEFGSMWDVYNDNPDVHKVIDQAVKEGWYNDETKLTSRLQNTNWFRTTESATRQYNIKKSTDPATLDADINREVEDTRALSLKTGSGIVLADGTLRMLAENKIKFGWSPQQLLNAIGSESVATATSGGPQGTASLRQGSVSTKLKGLADDYAQKIDQGTFDMWTADILKGTKTEDQFTDQMKIQASQQFRSLAPQIDKGQTVKTAVTMYANATKNILGIDPSTIDWTQDKWNSALNYKDPKTNEYRTMDAFEWNKHLRSQPEWKNTDDARTIYRNIALNLASGFGKAL